MPRSPVHRGSTSPAFTHRSTLPRDGGSSVQRRNGADTPSAAGSRGYYEEYVSTAEALQGVGAGNLFVGSLRINARRRTEAYALVAGLGVDVLIDGEKDRNRCLDGDICAIELLGESQWGARSGLTTAPESAVEASPVALQRVPAAPLGGPHYFPVGPDSALALPLDQASALSLQLYGPSLPAVSPPAPDDDGVSAIRDAEVDGHSGLDAAVAHRLPPPILAATKSEMSRAAVRAASARTQDGTLQPRGRVVALLHEVHRRTVIGVLRPADDRATAMDMPIKADHGFVMLRPLDPRVPFIVIPRHEAPADFLARPAVAATRLFSVAISTWRSTSRFPLGHITGGVGEAGEIASETQALLAEAGVDDGPFDAAALACLAPFLDDSEAGASVVAGASDVAVAAVGRRGWCIPQSEVAVRKDLRETRIFTIDRKCRGLLES